MLRSLLFAALTTASAASAVDDHASCMQPGVILSTDAARNTLRACMASRVAARNLPDPASGFFGREPKKPTVPASTLTAAAKTEAASAAVAKWGDAKPTKAVIAFKFIKFQCARGSRECVSVKTPQELVNALNAQGTLTIIVEGITGVGAGLAVFSVVGPGKTLVIAPDVFFDLALGVDLRILDGGQLINFGKITSFLTEASIVVGGQSKPATSFTNYGSCGGPDIFVVNVDGIAGSSGSSANAVVANHGIVVSNFIQINGFSEWRNDGEIRSELIVVGVGGSKFFNDEGGSVGRIFFPLTDGFEAMSFQNSTWVNLGQMTFGDANFVGGSLINKGELNIVDDLDFGSAGGFDSDASAVVFANIKPGEVRFSFGIAPGKQSQASFFRATIKNSGKMLFAPATPTTPTDRPTELSIYGGNLDNTGTISGNMLLGFRCDALNGPDGANAAAFRNRNVITADLAGWLFARRSTRECFINERTGVVTLNGQEGVTLTFFTGKAVDGRTGEVKGGTQVKNKGMIDVKSGNVEHNGIMRNEKYGTFLVSSGRLETTDSELCSLDSTGTVRVRAPEANGI